MTNYILVTGGAGYIGSHTVAQLIKTHRSVIVYDNLSTGFREAVPQKAVLIQGDILDTEHLVKILRHYKIQTIIHFAAKLIVPESIENPLLYYHNNVMGMCSILKACAETQVKHLIFSSTAAVYGIPPYSQSINEDTPPAPINPYGHSKLMAEQILKDFAKVYNLRYVILRYFNVAGASNDGNNGQRTLNATHLIKVACEVATKKRPKMEVFGTDYPTPDGTCIRDYIHVEDLAEAHILATSYLETGGTNQIFNCGYGQGYSVLEVLNTLAEVSQRPIAFEKAQRRPGDPPYLVADSSKLRTTLNWQPKYHHLKEICKSAFDWELKLSSCDYQKPNHLDQ